MSFYGNITNTSRSPFTFDRIYSNRVEMENAHATDGVFAGRYVLIEYDKQFSNKRITRVYRNEDDNSVGTAEIKLYKDIDCSVPVESVKVGEIVVVRETDEISTSKFLTNDQINRIRNFYTSGELVEGDYFCDIAETVNDEPVITRVFFDESAMILQKIDPSTTETEAANIEIMKEKEILFSYYRCETLPTVENPYNTFTLVTDSNVENETKSLKNYLTNAKVDYNAYEGTFDSTVWEKIYIGEDEQYIRIANLNSRFPTLTVSADAPSENPIPPHFDPAGLGETYNLHVQNQWGLRVAAADGALSTYGMIQDDDGDYITKKNYLKNKLSDVIDEIINIQEGQSIDIIISSVEDELKNKVYSKIDLSGFKEEVSKSETLADDRLTIVEKYSNSLLKESYKSDEDIVWSNSNKSGEYTAAQDENGDLVWVDGENGKYPGAIYYNKAGFDSDVRSRTDDEDDYISLESTGFSQVYDEDNKEWINQPYNDEDNIIVGSTTSAPDTKEVRINLPSVGNTISDVWDLTYGEERKKSIEWEKNNGIRMVIPNDEVDTGYNYKTKAVSTIAGCINSVQDLMGKIIEISDKSFATLGQNDIINLSYDNIYYSSADKKFYYKEDQIDFNASYTGKIIETEEDYKNKVQGYSEITLTDQNNINENYFYKDGADFIYDSVGSLDRKYYRIDASLYNISINEEYYKQVGKSFRKLRDGEGFSNNDVFIKVSDKDFEDGYYAYVRNKFFIKTTNDDGQTVYRRSSGAFNAFEDYYLLKVGGSSIVEIDETETVTTGSLSEFKVYHGRELKNCEVLAAYDENATYYYLLNNSVCPKVIKPTEEEYKQMVENKTIYYCNNTSISQLKMLNPESQDVYLSTSKKDAIERYGYQITTNVGFEQLTDEGFFKVNNITDLSKYSDDYDEEPIFYKLKSDLEKIDKETLDFTSCYRLIEGEEKRYQKINNETSIKNDEQLYQIIATLLNLNFYKPYVYFTKDEDGFYVLCGDDNYDSSKTYYTSSKGEYIVTNSYGGYHAGQVWDNDMQWNEEAEEIKEIEVIRLDDSLTPIENRVYYNSKECTATVKIYYPNKYYRGTGEFEIKLTLADDEQVNKNIFYYDSEGKRVYPEIDNFYYYEDGNNNDKWTVVTFPIKEGELQNVYCTKNTDGINYTPIDTNNVFVKYEPNKYYFKNYYPIRELATEENKLSGYTYYYGNGYDEQSLKAVNNLYNYEPDRFYYKIKKFTGISSASAILNCKLVAKQDLIYKQRIKELVGFAYNYNTIHGLILRLNRILREGDFTTRDISTVQGALNRLNDEIGRIGSYNLSTIQTINDKINSFKQEIKDLQEQVDKAQDILNQLKELLGSDLSVGDILTVKNYKDKLYNFYTINGENYNPTQIIDLLYNKVKNLEDFIADQFNGKRGLSEYNFGYREMRFIADMISKKNIPLFDQPGYGGTSSKDKKISQLQTLNQSVKDWDFQGLNVNLSPYDIVPYILINKDFRKQKTTNKNYYYRVTQLTNNSFFVNVQNMVYIDISWLDYPDYKNYNKKNVKSTARKYQNPKTWVTFFTLKEVKPLKTQSLNLTVNIQENTDLTGECILHRDGTLRCRFDKKYREKQSLRVRGWVLIEPVTELTEPALINPLEFSTATAKYSTADEKRIDKFVNSNKNKGVQFIP